ncbi:MAG: ABC transporter permease subunit [Gammaproteobacteria bacterium]
MATAVDDIEIAEYLKPAAVGRRRMWREIKDRAFKYTMWVGGVAVIAAIALIFFYLLYVVFPLFRSAEITPLRQYPVPGGVESRTAYLNTEDYGEVGFRLTAAGQAILFDVVGGNILSTVAASGIGNAKVTSVAHGRVNDSSVALGLDNGQAIIAKPVYAISYPDGKRKLDAKVGYPLGEAAIGVDPKGQPLELLALQAGEEKSTLVALTSDHRLQMARVSKEAPTLDLGDAKETFNTERFTLPMEGAHVTGLLLDYSQSHLILAKDDGSIDYYSLAKPEDPILVDHKSVVPSGARITDMQWLSGGISLLIGDSRGMVTQWFPVRDANNKISLAHVREFHVGDAAVTSIVPEFSRKGIAVLDAAGRCVLLHTTAERILLTEKVAGEPLVAGVISPRADRMIVEDGNGSMHVYSVRNKHPEISWHALWGKVWYESRPGPEYVWQSSAANSDFEPKFSLMPLSFGTLKAAFYAMLFAVPFAIMAAIYTAYFMNPRMREWVKPIIELMGALPTVILGFLAGLWLAPLVEANLLGVLLFFVLVPTAILTCAWLWSRLPESIRHRVPDGNESVLLVPVVVAACILAMWLGPYVENAFFDGNTTHWITQHLGLRYDQRNSLVVGIAMGVAVVPIIFSISEDAIIGVPRHLTIGSLALGATPWQTLIRIVLLTASPGIFSAIMIGLGRAVGETMIVLMATGNTPVMDFNIFEGFRALSANTAVEMPESEVNSTHYRLLFLASLLLFLFTFIFNTVAEVVRHRLRAKYSHL